MPWKTIDNLILKNSSIMEGRVWIDYKIYDVGGYIRIDYTGMEIVSLHNDKPNLKSIGVDLV